MFDVSTPIADKPAVAMKKLLNEYKPMKLAGLLRVHNAHVYRFRRDGHMSPTLEDALIDAGCIPAPPKRYRSHVEHGRGPTGAAHKARLQAWLARNGFENLTQAVNELIGEIDDG